MRIVFFTNCYKPLINGVVTSIVSLKEAYGRKGHETYIFAPKVEDYIDQEKNVFRYRSVNLTSKAKYPIAIPLSFRAKKVITEFNPDIIHVHHPFVLSSPAIMYGEKLGIPKILTLHTQYERYAHYAAPIPQIITQKAIKSIISNLAYKIDCITTPSILMKDSLRSCYGITKRIEVIPNAINLASFREKDDLKCFEIRKKYDLKEENKIILFVGRIAPEKSIDKIIKALAIIKRKCVTGVKLVIVGSGLSLEDLKKLVISLGVGNDVIFTGNVEYKDVKHYYKIGYTFATASTTEVNPLTIIEALASGIPVLAVRAPGAVDILTDGVDGLLTENNVEQFAIALEKLIREPELRKKLSQGALKTSEQYSINVISERMLNLYREVITMGNFKEKEKEKKSFIKNIFFMDYGGKKIKDEK